MRPNTGLFGVSGALSAEPVFGGIWQFSPSRSSFLARPLLFRNATANFLGYYIAGFCFRMGFQCAAQLWTSRVSTRRRG